MVLGVVICSVHTEDTVPFTFIMVDQAGGSLVVTTYNLSPGRGVIIGDTVAIAEPHFTRYSGVAQFYFMLFCNLFIGPCVA